MTYKSQQEKDSAIAALKAQLEEAEKATVSGRWKPNYRSRYFFISDKCEPRFERWMDTDIDRQRFNGFNVFPTQEKAQLEADKTLIWRELRTFCRECNGDEVVDWDNFNQHKWGLLLWRDKITVREEYHYNVFLAGCAFVGPNAEANAHAALEKFGDRLHLLTTP